MDQDFEVLEAIDSTSTISWQYIDDESSSENICTVREDINSSVKSERNDNAFEVNKKISDHNCKNVAEEKLYSKNNDLIENGCESLVEGKLSFSLKNNCTEIPEKEILHEQPRNKYQISTKLNVDILSYIKECLCGKLFSGWVEERTWIDLLQAYRDIIEIDECEAEINLRFKAILNGIPGVSKGTKWINITGPSSSISFYRIWTLLKTPPFPGHYWFHILDITLDPKFGLKFNIDIVRKVDNHDCETLEEHQLRKKILTGEYDHFKEWQTFLLDRLSSIRHFNTSAFYTLFSSIGPYDIVESIRFAAVLILTITVGLLTLTHKMAQYLLLLIRELGIFIQLITPFLNTFFAFLEKVFGGIFILIAMVYRDIRAAAFYAYFRRRTLPPTDPVPQSLPPVRSRDRPALLFRSDDNRTYRDQSY